MGQNNLIGLERALVNIPSAQATDQNTIDVLIGAVSDYITRYCRRDFRTRFYDELYSGDGDRRLLLRQYPLQTVDSVRYRPVTVLKIINNAGPGSTQQSRVQVAQTGLQLMEMSSGVRTMTTSGLTYAAQPTIAGLAGAINAIGRGWTAQVVGDSAGDYGLWPSADLFVANSFGNGPTSQGSMTCMRQSAELKLHTYELAGYQWDSRGWLLRAIPYTDPELIHPEDLIWPVGVNNFRVQYTAGYVEVPEAVQEACAQWVSRLWFHTQRDPALGAQTIPGQISQTWGASSSGQPPANVATLLAPFRRYSMASNQG
jgi:hypothetical protein